MIRICYNAVMSEHAHTTHESTAPGLHITTDVYEGPLEVLLEMIQKRKLFINDLSLADVSDDFLGFIRSQEAFPVEVSTQFLEIASTLMLLKSKSLLPNLDITDEDEADIHDLEDRLAAHKRIQELSAYVRERWGAAPMYRRRARGRIAVVFAPTDEIRPDTCLRIIRDCIKRIPTEQDIPQVGIGTQVSLKETIDELSSRVQRAMNTRFSDVAGYRSGSGGYKKQERLHVVLHFLAMLELVKTGLLDAVQYSHYDDIHLEHTNVDTPHYGNLDDL